MTQELHIPRITFAALGTLFVSVSLLTLAGYPNGLSMHTFEWWAVIGLLFADGVLFAVVTILLGSRLQRFGIGLGYTLVAANLILMAMDQFGVSDLIVATLLIAAAIALFRR